MEDGFQVARLPQVQPREVHPLPQALRQAPPAFAREQAGAHIAVAPEDVQQIPVFRPAVLYVIEQVQKRGEYRSVPFFQQAFHLADELRAEVFHQIAEQFLFVCEIHVKAAPGNPRPMDDPVDRGLGKGGPDKFGPAPPPGVFPAWPAAD